MMYETYDIIAEDGRGLESYKKLPHFLAIMHAKGICIGLFNCRVVYQE